MSARPLPVPDELSAGYWEQAARHEFALARCAHCQRFAHPPDLVCPHCGSTDPRYRFEPVPGAGSVRSWTVVRRSFLPGFEVPFVLVDVELTLPDEPGGPRVIGRLIDGPEIALHLGVAVQVAFEDVADGVAVPAFTLGSGG